MVAVGCDEDLKGAVTEIVEDTILNLQSHLDWQETGNINPVFATHHADETVGIAQFHMAGRKASATWWEDFQKPLTENTQRILRESE